MDFLVTEVIKALLGQWGSSQHQLLDLIVVDVLCSLPGYCEQVVGSTGRIPSRKLSLPSQVNRGGSWHMTALWKRQSLLVSETQNGSSDSFLFLDLL